MTTKKLFGDLQNPKQKRKLECLKNTHLLRKIIKSEMEATELSGMLYKVKITRITLKIKLTFHSSLFHRIS
jgi:hypothetical protein